MGGTSPNIVSATQADYFALVSVLVEAFQNDPLAHWLYPDPQVRRQSHIAFFTRKLATLGAESFVDKTETGEAVAIWHRFEYGGGKGSNDDEPFSELPPEAVAFFAAVDAAAPPRPHLYLSFLAAKNSGKGAGSALLRHRLALSGERVALWTANPRNVPFYERRGFALFAHIEREGAQAWWFQHGA